MIADEPHPAPPEDGRSILIAVITAAATTLVTGLVTWAVDELRAKYGSAPPLPSGKDQEK